MLGCKLEVALEGTMVSDCTFRQPGSSASGAVTDSVAETKSLISGHSRKVESTTFPYLLLWTKRLPLLNLIWLLDVPDEIQFLRSLSRIDSPFLSAAERSGFMEM